MSSLAISAQSTQYVTSNIAASSSPTAASVSFAFLGPYGDQGLASGAVPTSTTTYYTGSWGTGVNGSYLAQCLVGPSGGVVALTTGTYNVWVKIFGTLEIPVLLSGILIVE